MKKQIEVGYIYPTQGGHGEVQIFCTDLTEGFSVLGIRTDKHGGKHLYRCNSAGKCHYESIYGGDLILPDAEPEYRAWTFDEVPVGAIVRVIKPQHIPYRALIVKVNSEPVSIYVGETTYFFPHQMLDWFEVLINGTWQPCGVQL